MAGNRISCPACHAPVPAAGGPETEAPPEPGPPAPVRRRPATGAPKEVSFTPSLNRTAETAGPGETGFLQNLKHTSEQSSGKHVRVKKRRKAGGDSMREALTDWNSDASGGIPEAELNADTWTAPASIPEEVIREKERDFVVGEHSEDGRTVTRVKRVRKRRIFTLAQLFFRRLSYGMRVVTVAIVSAIAVTGVWYGIKIFRQKFTPVTFADVVAEQRPDRVFLTSQDESGAVEKLAAYLAAQGPEAKLPHVRLPNRVRPMMETWYQKHPDAPATVGGVRARAKQRAGDNYFVILEVEVTGPDPANPGHTRTVTRAYAVEERETDGVRSYLVDWETASEWGEMTFAEFKQQQPQKTVPFRIKIRGSGYYNHLFTDEQRWLAAELYYPHPGGENEFLFYGYLDRTSKAFEDLAIYTEPGNNASVILGLRYPENPVSRDQVIIESLIHPSWFYAEDKPPPDWQPAAR